MYLIVGLGNPGTEYEKTRHNAGFVAIDAVNKALGLYGFKAQRKFKSEFAESSIARQKALLLKPATFMNNSGEAVSAVARFYKITALNIIVVHDDKDISVGKMKIQINRGSAGHNGVQSIIEKLGTQNFIRIRIGIAPLRPTKKSAADFVLSRFTASEEKLLKPLYTKVVQALETIVKEGIEKAMQNYLNIA